MTTQPDYLTHFRRYAEAYEASLGDHVETERIRAFFANEFMGLSIAGGINVGKNDETFVEALQQGFAFYKGIGTTAMRVIGVDFGQLAENHDRVRVSYVAGYRRKDGTVLDIEFDVVYLLQRQQAGPKIFAFIAGDEFGAYRKHGLVDAEGRPI